MRTDGRTDYEANIRVRLYPVDLNLIFTHGVNCSFIQTGVDHRCL